MNLKTKKWSKGSFEQKRVGELERGKARVLCEDQEICVRLALGARSCKEEGRRKLGLQRTRDFKV